MATEAEILATRLVTEGMKKFEGDMAKADRAVGKTADSIDESSKSGIGFGDMLGAVAKGIAGATAAAATMGLVFKKALDLGKAGATVVQATESFEGLVEQMGLGIEFMGRLEEAAGGTIDTMSLMAGVGTLVAGTSEDFGRELALAYPQLIEYARAAAKLNPHLGTTTEMLSSIALGLKRNSPMILDNLGIVVKLGPANEAYAESMGITVAQMTAEDKSLALLNATMEAGARLVEQVGGNVESAIDPFVRLEVATKNLADTLMAQLAPGLSAAAEAATILISWSGNIDIALAEQEERVRGTAASYDDYVQSMANALAEAGRLMPRQAAQIVQMVDQGKSVDNLAERYGFLTEAEFDHAEMVEAGRVWMEGFTDAIALQDDAIEDHIEIVRSAAEEQWLLNEQTKDDRLRTQDWTDALEALETALEDDEAAAEEAADAFYEVEAATRAADAATGDYFAEVIEATDETWEMADAMWESAKAADWDAQQMAILGGALGLYTEEQVEAALMAAALAIRMDELAASVADGTMTVEDAIEAFYDLKDAIDSVPDRKHTSFTYSINQVAIEPALGGGGVQEDGGGTSSGESVEQQVERQMRRVRENIRETVSRNVQEAVRGGVSRGVREGAREGAEEGVEDAEQEIIDVLEGMLTFGKGIGGVGGAFARRLEREQLKPLEERLELVNAEIEALQERAAAGQLAIPGAIRLLELEREKGANLAEQAELQETMLGLERQRQDLAFLEHQVKLLDIIREYGLDAEDILGGMTLGINASTERLIHAMTAAMSEIIESVEEELQIGSPSMKFAEIGTQMMAGLSQSIAAGTPNIQAQIQAAVLPPNATTNSGDYFDQRQYHTNLTTQSTIRPGGLAMEFAAIEMVSR